MPVLLQCPRCGFNYVKPEREADQLITCRRCQLVFRAAVGDTVAPSPPPPTPAPEVFPFPVPVTIPATPTHFVLEQESIHEVEHIEVLDDAPAPAAPKPGSLEIDAQPPSAHRFDEVDVIEPLHTSKQPPIVDAEVILEPSPPPPTKGGPALDKVEVVEDAGATPMQPAASAPAAPMPAPPPIATTPAGDIAREPPPPVPRRERKRSLDIRKPESDGVPIGVWLGLAGGGVALLLLIVVLVIVLRTGGTGPVPVVVANKAGQPVAAPPEQYLPPAAEWPKPPDQRGQPPWLPPPFKAAAAPPEVTNMEGLIGYWNCDEGKGNAVADGSKSGHKSTMVGAWWIDGVRGNALLFDGRRDYLDLGNSGALNFPKDGAFTIAGWFATRQRDGYILAFRNPRNLAPMIQVKLSGGALCGVVRADGSENGEARVGLAPAADGRWHHFALLRHTGGIIECYLDGQSLDKHSGANTLGPITTTLRAVGCERSRAVTQGASAAYCACAIDELCIFGRALTVQEVVKLAVR